MTRTNAQKPQQLPQHQPHRINLLSTQTARRAKNQFLESGHEVTLRELKACVQQGVDFGLDGAEAWVWVAGGADAGAEDE